MRVEKTAPIKNECKDFPFWFIHIISSYLRNSVHTSSYNTLRNYHLPKTITV